MENEMQIERLKEEEGLGGVFLKIDIVIDDVESQIDTKTDRILDAIKEVCEKEGLIREWVMEDNERVVLNFWVYHKKEHLDFLQTKRNKLNREISTLKKAQPKN